MNFFGNQCHDYCDFLEIGCTVGGYNFCYVDIDLSIYTLCSQLSNAPLANSNDKLSFKITELALCI